MQLPAAGRRSLDEILGFEGYEREGGGVARGRMSVTDTVRQPFGIVHGGALAALAETVTSRATYEAVGPGQHRDGQSNETNFLRPIRRARSRPCPSAAPRSDDLGLGRRADRRRGAAVRALAHGDRRAAAAERRPPATDRAQRSFAGGFVLVVALPSWKDS